MTRIAIAQINPTVGAIRDNTDKIIRFARLAEKESADLVVFPELAVTGYPPEDLLLKKSFVLDNLKALGELAAYSKKVSMIVGFVGQEGRDIFNAAALLRGGRIAGVYRKMCLPNYGVFDEKRYFTPGKRPFVFSLNDKRLKFAVTICEDIWYPDSLALMALKAKKPNIIINISASPYHREKEEMRERVLRTLSKSHKAIAIYCNMVGGQDELVFDGACMAVDSNGALKYRSKRFEENLSTIELDTKLLRQVRVNTNGRCEPKLDKIDEIYKSLVLGTKDYLAKNGFSKAVLGLSGGIDSSLTAKIACDAIGRENVIGVSMPSRYSSSGTMRDAKAVTENLGISLMEIPIEPIFQTYISSLKSAFKDEKENVTEENLQARIRGNILMALSNKFGWLTLTTGNKSEISMGYCTLYGDMAGGFAVIKDVPKTLVYKLAGFVNRECGRKIIPDTVIARPPTAELRPNQKDEDSLPPYNILDPILKLYIEDELTIEEIAKKGFDRKLAADIMNKVDRNEYKRRQSPPGVKITPRAFGKDRRFPIVNSYNHRPRKDT